MPSDYLDACAYPVEFIKELLLVKPEQTLKAGLFQISRKDLAGTVSHPLVNDGSGPAFCRVGIRQLMCSGFIKTTAQGTPHGLPPTGRKT